MEFVDASDLGEALAALDERGDDAMVLAGGTDVVVQFLRRDIRPGRLVHIGHVDSLRGISSGERTRIGATTTHWKLATSETILAEHCALAEAAATVGGRQTQNAGTIGGNVANASPAADLIPALLVGGADVTIASSSGERTVPLSEFLVDRKRTVLKPNELVTAISLERPAPRTGETYLKVGRRKAMEVAIVGLAARLTLDGAGVVADARIAVCSVGPTAFRVPEAEAALVGTRADDDAIAAAGSLLAAAARPIDDVRGTATYRRRVLAPLLRRAVLTCIGRAES